MFGAILAQVFDTALDARLAGLSLPADVLREIAAQKAKMAGIQVADPLAQRAVREAFFAGSRAVMLVSAALAALSAAVTALALGRKQADPIPP